MTRAQQCWLYGSLGAAAATGLSFASMKYLMTGDDPFSAYHHPLQPHALHAHVLIAPAVVFVVGWIFGAHALRQARAARGGLRSGARSGWAMLAAALPMVATGYLMQVVTGDVPRAGLAWAHGIAGGAFVVSLAVHARRARRRRRAAVAAG